MNQSDQTLLHWLREALYNVPRVGDVYDQQHSDTHQRAVVIIDAVLQGLADRPAEVVGTREREIRAALQWLLDDMSDAGESHNRETGVEYDSCRQARETLERYPLGATEPRTPHKVFIVFGERSTVRDIGQDSINEFEFKTNDEVNAFLRGVDAMDGWLNYTQFDTLTEAKQHVAEILAEQESDEAEEEGETS